MLVISLTVPSYAALSSADGSIFITKSQFDSAMSDFSSRLTTFEAGINSKIDSQVTSYLDSNGIWSGKTQTMVPPYSFATPISFKDKGTNTTNWSMFLTVSNTPTLANIRPCTWYHYDEKLWSNVNKSGLMHVSLIFECDSLFKLNRTGVKINNNVAWEKTYQAGYAITAIMPTETVDIVNNLACLELMLNVPASGDYTTIHVPLAFGISVKETYFFVSKGMDVYFSTCWQVVSNTAGVCTVQNLCTNSQYAGSYLLTITDAQIY